jgi:hypothetical protein
MTSNTTLPQEKPAKLVRYGKPAAPMLAHKRDFFEQNERLLTEAKRWAKLYARQAQRTACKVCGAPLPEPAFTKLGVEYAFCSRCGHLNGAHDDSEAFCSALYTDDRGEAYARAYAAEERQAWEQRRDDIYMPKAEFLLEALDLDNAVTAELALADFGAGSGYFVGSLLAKGLPNVRGFEVSRAQVALGNAMLGSDRLTVHDAAQTANIAETVDAGVVSFIGVIEHLRNPREVLANLRDNKRVRYLYFSVPLFSTSVFIEMAFPNVTPRHLTGGHTHLFTEQSIDWTLAELGFGSVAEWWFGADVVDLYRSLLVTIEGSGAMSTDAPDTLRQWLMPAVDDMQESLDRRKLCSEVHVVARRVSGRN